MQRVAPALAMTAGLFLVGLGIGIGGTIALSVALLTWAACGFGLLGAVLLVRLLLPEWVRERRLLKEQEQMSELAAQWAPMLLGSYTPYVIEAAERLAEARDATSVPTLLCALEQTVETQQPGWRDRAEAFACALGRIGDRRALPLLYRLEDVRGIGFIPAVRHAIAAIEPLTSLLRPSSAAQAQPETLLRPASLNPDSNSASLLRPVEMESL